MKTDTELSEWPARWEVVRSILPQEPVEAALSHLRSALTEELGKMGCRETSPSLAGAWCSERLRSDSQDGLTDSEVTLLRGQFPAKVRLSPVVLQVAKEIHSSGLFEQALGLEFPYLHLPPMARFVFPGNTGAGVPPHHDWQYNAHMTAFVNVWVPLVDITRECGGVTIWEGASSKKSGDESGNSAPKSLGVVREWHEAVSTSGMVARDCAPMGVGDILMFGSEVLHGSMANTSSHTRFSMEFRFLPRGGSSSKPVLDLVTLEKQDTLN